MDAGTRADLAESLVPVAAELAWLVRDEGREAIGEWLDAHGVIAGARITEATRAFLVVLAAMVNGTAAPDELLSWVTWDQDGRPLEQTIPLLPVIPVGREAPAEPALRSPAQRLEEYAGLRARKVSMEDAAGRIGVHLRTAERYEAKLKARAGAGLEEQRGEAA